MQRISFGVARANLAKTMDELCESHEPVVVTRGHASIVMIALDDFKALQETTYLLRSPNNAKRLLESISELEEGRGHEPAKAGPS